MLVRILNADHTLICANMIAIEFYFTVYFCALDKHVVGNEFHIERLIHSELSGLGAMALTAIHDAAMERYHRAAKQISPDERTHWSAWAVSDILVTSAPSSLAIFHCISELTRAEAYKSWHACRSEDMKVFLRLCAYQLLCVRAALRGRHCQSSFS